MRNSFFLIGEHNCMTGGSSYNKINPRNLAIYLAFAILILLSPESLVMCHIAEAKL